MDVPPIVKVAELEDDVQKLEGVEQELVAEKASHERVLAEMNRLIVEVSVHAALPTNTTASTSRTCNWNGAGGAGSRCEGTRLLPSARRSRLSICRRR